MNDWKGPTIQVIGILLGSSVILGFINNFISTINQPDIQVTVLNPYSFNYKTFEDFSIPPSMDVNYQIKIRNVGESPATNVNLFLKFPDNSKNIQIKNVESTENITKKNLKLDTNKITGSLKRLGIGAGISIDVNVRMYNISHLFASSYLFHDDPKDLTDCIITLSYDQNTNTFNCNSTGFSFSLVVPSLIYIILLIIFLYIILSSRIKIYKKNRKSKDFVLQVKNDVYDIFDTFNKNHLSKMILPFETWYTLSENEKHQIFNNFDDYKNIDKLYEDVKNRHQACSTSDIDDETLEVYNNRCHNLSKRIIEIEWTTYYNKQPLQRPVPIILIILLSAFSITLIESYFISNTNFFNKSDTFLPGISIPGVAWFFIFIVRTLVSFILIVVLIKKILTNLTKYKIQSLNEVNLKQTNYLKFFALSVAIMGIPSTLPYFIISFYTSTSDYSFSFFIILSMLFDFWRMKITIRIITEFKSYFQFNIKISKIICFLSGIICIVSFLYSYPRNEISSVQSIINPFLIIGIWDIFLGFFIHIQKPKFLKIGLITNSIAIIYLFFVLVPFSQFSYIFFQSFFPLFILILMTIKIIYIKLITDINDQTIINRNKNS